MLQVAAYPLPEESLLQEYAQKPGYYTDCFATEITGMLPLADFVEAFYTTPLFKAERLILRWAARMPSTDAEARDVAQGKRDKFAAWHVRGRDDRQLLMKAVGRTASWFMIEPAGHKTRLLFGSFVAPQKTTGQASPRLGLLFAALLGAHRLYSVLLLASARSRLQRINRGV